MATVGLVRTAWSGTSGGPGLTQTFVEDATGATMTATQGQTAANAVRAFWDAVKGYIPNEVTLTTSPVVDLYDVPSGALAQTVISPTTPASVVGTGTAAYSMAAGIKVILNTNLIMFGRRVKGGIYIVPAVSTAMTDAGLVSAGARTAINTAGSAMISALSTGGMNLVVYSRKKEEPVARDGFTSIVALVETNEKGAVLRGRRD